MIYYGFFDAAFDEKTGAYDRTYNSGDFVRYFENFIGSGVCVYNNPNSFKVSVSGTNAVIASGYLFIRGYWLKNDSDYAISFSGVGDGVYAVYAKLNLGARLIELGQMVKADSYTDTLVLAYVTISNGVLSVEDTRYNADVCGVIDAVGSLTSKIEYAINYIDTQIESKLQQIEQDLQNQSDIINSKLDEANALIAKIAKPPIGTVKFSASSTIEQGWLKCDGSFISESQYPELVAALGKLTPSGDKFQLIDYSGNIPSTGITNFVLYDEYLWTFCLSNRILYGIPVNGGQLKEITVTSDDEQFNNLKPNSLTNPLALSIVPLKTKIGAKVFISQILKSGVFIQPLSLDRPAFDDYQAYPQDFKTALVILGADFSSSAQSIVVNSPIQTIKECKIRYESSNDYDVRYNQYNDATETRLDNIVMYVMSQNNAGVETFYCAVGQKHLLTYNSDSNDTSTERSGIAILTWTDSSTEADIVKNEERGEIVFRSGFSDKNNGEVVSISDVTVQSSPDYNIYSFPYNTYNGYFSTSKFQSSQGCLNVVGTRGIIFDFSLEKINGTNNISIEGINLAPELANIFLDAGIYLFDKDIYLFFVGTGIIFSRAFKTKSDIGYLDTTSVLGVIRQYGDLRYDDKTGTLYIMGQDTTNKIKAAKIVLNTLYDYANDGAWLPLIASDGVPAWIKAKEVT